MQVRSRGELRFVLIRGVLLAVVFEILSFLVIDIWYEHKRFDGLLNYALADGVAWLMGGLFAGAYEWSSNEKRYHRELVEFSSANYESPEQTLKQLQRGVTNVG
jgi:hypothetical protein